MKAALTSRKAMNRTSIASMLLSPPVLAIAAEIVPAAAVVAPAEVAGDVVVVGVMVVAEAVVATVVAVTADMAVAAEVATKNSSRKLKGRDKSRGLFPLSVKPINHECHPDFAR